MKKIILHSLVFLSTFTVYDARALSVNDFLSPAVGIAATAICVVGAPIVYLIGSRGSEARRIEQERLLFHEKNEDEKQKNWAKSKQLLHEIKVEYAEELAVIWNGNELMNEEFVKRASARFNHETPFIHANYARKLQNYLARFRELSFEDSSDEREFAEKLEIALIKIFEKHNLAFKAVLVKELVEEKKALVEQQKLDHQEAVRREELQAKKMETRYLENLNKGLIEFKDQSQRELEAITQNALINQNKMAEYSAAMHANNIANHAKILQDIRYEITNNGLRSLANYVHELYEEIVQLRRLYTLSSKEMNGRIDELKNSLKEVKSAAVNARGGSAECKKELENIFKKIDAMEASLAVISADVGDIKSGNFNSEPSAPHF